MQQPIKIQLWHDDMFLHEFEAKSWKIRVKTQNDSRNYYNNYYKSWKGSISLWPFDDVRKLDITFPEKEIKTYECLFDNLIWSQAQNHQIDAIIDEKLMFTQIIYHERMFKYCENSYEYVYTLQYRHLHGNI
jgi:hypothetical protein